MKNWKRVGRCNNCSMCCLFKDGIKSLDKKRNKDEIELKIKGGWIKIHETKKKIMISRLMPCAQLYLSIRGKWRCNLHGKCKPKTCKLFPLSPDQAYYKIIKKWCGYKFIRVKT